MRNTKFNINKEKTKELLFRLTKDDFKVEFFCAGGHGGQNMQKNATACRITHPESGAVGLSRDERSQMQNKKKAFLRMSETKEFINWHKVKCARLLGQAVDIEDWLEEQMKPENLKIEIIEGGK